MNDYTFLTRNNLHIFSYNGRQLDFTTDQLDALIFDYVKDGNDMPQEQMTVKYELTIRELRFILNNTPGGVTKDSPPHSYKTLQAHSNEELAELEIIKRKKSYRSGATSKRITALSKENQKLQAQLNSEVDLQNKLCNLTRGFPLSSGFKQLSTDEDALIF